MNRHISAKHENEVEIGLNLAQLASLFSSVQESIGKDHNYSEKVRLSIAALKVDFAKLLHDITPMIRRLNLNSDGEYYLSEFYAVVMLR